MLLALALAGCAWWARDLPRRWVESVLAEALGARVRVGSVRFRFGGELKLGEVEVRDVASEPRLAQLHVGELVARGSWRAMLRGRFEVLELAGVRGTLASAPSSPPGQVAEPRSVLARQLLVRDARFGVATTPAEIDLEATLHDLGTAIHGNLHLRVRQVSMHPLLALLDLPAPPFSGAAEEIELRADFSSGRVLRYEGRLRGIEVQAGGAALGIERLSLKGRLDAGEGSPLAGQALAEATGIRVTTSGGGARVEVPDSTLEARVEGLPGEGRMVELHARLVQPHSGYVRAVVDRDSLRIAHLRVDLRRVSVAALARAWSIPGVEPTSGEGDLTVEGEPRERLRVQLGVRELGGRWHSAARASAVRLAHGSLALQAELDPVHRAARGSLRLEAKRLQGRVGDLELPEGLVPLVVSAEGRVGLEPEFFFRGTIRADTPVSAPVALEGHVASGHGNFFADLRYELPPTPVERLWSLVPERAARLPFVVRGSVRASGRIRGSLLEPSVETSAALEGFRLEAAVGGAPVRLEGRAELNGRFDARSNRFGGRLVLGRANATVFSMAPVGLEAGANVRIEDGAGTIEDLVLALDGGRLARLRARARWPAEETPPGRGEVELELGDLGAWAEKIPVGRSPIPPGYTVSGRPGARLSFARAGDAWRAEGPLSLSGFSLASEDGGRVVQGPALEGEAEIHFSGDFQAWDASVRGVAGGFEVLWDTFYGDYSHFAAEIGATFRGRRTASASWSLQGEGQLDVGEALRVRATTEKSSDVPARSRIALEAPALERLAPYLHPWAALENLAGAARAEAVIESPLVETRVHLGGLDFSWPDRALEVRGFDLDLPFQFVRSRGDEGREDAPEGSSGATPEHGRMLEGQLGWESFRAGHLALSRARVPLLVDDEAVRLARPLELELFGGRVVLEGLALEHWREADRHLRSAVRLQRLRLAELAPALGLPPLEGDLDGHFPIVRVGRERLRVEGEGSLEVFGGRVRLYDIAGEEILSDYPRLEFSADFDGIHLDQLTKTLEFGEITGIARGHVRGCRLFRGVPVRFEGRLETVPRRGVPQRINVKAIHNISILGSGERIGILDRGLHRFFDRYTYARIGIEMKLDQDRFLLRGLAHRGGKELFVQGKLPFPIHVVNVAPGQAVSFRTMLERLRNLEVRTAP